MGARPSSAGSKTTPPSRSTSTRTVSPRFMRPAIISLLKGDPISLSMARRKGRAPKRESRPSRAMCLTAPDGGAGEGQVDVLFVGGLAEVIEEEASYLGEPIIAQRVEDDDLVHPVQELGPEIGP